MASTFGNLEQSSGLVRKPPCERNIGPARLQRRLHPTAEWAEIDDGPGPFSQQVRDAAQQTPPDAVDHLRRFSKLVMDDSSHVNLQRLSAGRQISPVRAWPKARAFPKR